MTALATELVALIERMIDERVDERVKAALSRSADEYLSTAEAARLAGVHRETIIRWIREGRLTEHRAGRCVRVKRGDLERLLARGRRRQVKLSPEERARRDFGDGG